METIYKMANYTSFFTRKELEAMQLTAEQISAISERHGNSITAMRDDYESQIASLKTDLEKAQSEKGDFEEKLQKSQKDFEDYKANKDAEYIKSQKVAAYKALLKDAKISEAIHDDILGLTNLDDLKLDKDGKIKDSEKLTESLTEKWSKFVVKETTQGADPSNHSNVNPAPNVTKADILKIKDTAERQQAIAENPQLFGFAPEE